MREGPLGCRKLPERMCHIIASSARQRFDQSNSRRRKKKLLHAGKGKMPLPSPYERSSAGHVRPSGQAGHARYPVAFIGEELANEGKMPSRGLQDWWAPSRSWMLAGCGNSTSGRPSVSTSARGAYAPLAMCRNSAISCSISHSVGTVSPSFAFWSLRAGRGGRHEKLRRCVEWLLFNPHRLWRRCFTLGTQLLKPHGTSPLSLPTASFFMSLRLAGRPSAMSFVWWLSSVSASPPSFVPPFQ
jgi:hypothetical protein